MIKCRRLTGPSGPLAAESHKRWYFYFDLDTKLPKFPKFFRLDRSASAAKARKLNASEYEVAISLPFSSSLANPAPCAFWVPCTKDAVTKDGIGLPGHHGCGTPEVRPGAPYLG